MRAHLREYFARRLDPYAGAVVEISRRLTGAAALAGGIISLGLLPAAPPTEPIGDPGWLLAALCVAGTLMGAGRYLKERNPAVQLVGVQPAESFHGIEGLKHLPTAITPRIYDESVPDRQVGVETEEAFDTARALARVEGLFVGSSTGAALVAALRLGAEALASGQPAVIVAIAPDNGSKYLSTGLWDHAVQER